MTFRYLHKTSDGNFYLDHRLNPSVRAMFCAMASRMPGGGIEARYKQIVDAVAEDFRGDSGWSIDTYYPFAEDALCKLEVHPKVQEFFDKFVLMYGHSSIMELTGSPSVYTQGISWYTAYLLFDSPLCSGQEFSTRAVRRKDWPMARECYVPAHHDLSGDEVQEGPFEDMMVPHPKLKELHDLWLTIFEHEVEAWKEFFSDADNRAAYGIQDKEPFRPALDRARWAIPGTIATGCAHTGHLRERSRVLRDGLLLAQKSNAPSAVKVWEDIRDCYSQAAPGLAHMGLREAVYDADTSRLPLHLDWNDFTVGDRDEVMVALNGWATVDFQEEDWSGRVKGERAYLDPTYNRMAQVRTSIRCSLAVARDWHRHRTMYPWEMKLVTDDKRTLTIHPAYGVKSEFGKANLTKALEMASALYWEFVGHGNDYLSMLCLPLGAQVELAGQAGLRDAVYCFELRRDAHGANFEYKAQATAAILALREELEEKYPGLPEHLGL